MIFIPVVVFVYFIILFLMIMHRTCLILEKIVTDKEPAIFHDFFFNHRKEIFQIPTEK